MLPAAIVADAGLTDTRATGGGVTATDAVPFCPSLVAVIVAAPTATPVTRPLPFTVAAAGLLDAHVTTRPDSAAPFASFGVAVSCPVVPAPTLKEAGLTATDATGTVVDPEVGSGFSHVARPSTLSRASPAETPR